jgi:hypothetical protein
LDDAPVVQQGAEAVPVEDEDLPLPDLESVEPAMEEATDEVGDLPSLDEEAPAEEEPQSE